MPPKSIFRQPGARHFQVVHRSQRDPLAHDPDANQHVLKEISRQNPKKGKGRADLEAVLDEDEIAQDARVGEAALYGIYYDDTEYDYMQHLRPVGVQEDGVESVLIEAPSSKNQDRKSGSKIKPGISLRDLPEEVLPSTHELPRTYESQQDIPQSISGFQPDMDPHLRQTLEALEDDAFVDDDLADDFFGALIEGGTRDSDEEPEYEFHEYGPSEDRQNDSPSEEPETWEKRFALFKATQKTHLSTSDNGDDYASEGEDTVSGLPAISVIGGKGKRRRKGGSDASGYSMSSSSMYRNEALQTLDERFDQVMLKEYNEDEDDDENNTDNDSSPSVEDDEAPQLITSREDFNAMMDEFLNNYEILGRKMKPVLDGETGAAKLDTLRRAMGQDERVHESYADMDDDVDDDNEFLRLDKEEKDQWDCETILTTYTNLENHPRVIRIQKSKPVPKIRLDPKTGLPSVDYAVFKYTSKPEKVHPAFANESDDSSSGEPFSQPLETITRPRNEDPESKKARKAAVKAKQAQRRAEKKATKQLFGKELSAAKSKVLQEPPTGVQKL
ncbi:Low temperature viability protein-domain-containing protein [Lentinula raphanica]|nr:Low temperature viability protein-domain-containing protein [Lentinula raphanica]